MYADYLEDLRDYALKDIGGAIKKYRQSGATFFPTSGQLVQIIRTIPAWDIRTLKEHGELLQHASARELAVVTARIGDPDIPLLETTESPRHEQL